MKATIYHLFDKKSLKHHYFGSIVAIFTVFAPEDIQTTKRALYKFDFDSGDFRNDHVEIFKGEVCRSKHTKN